MSERLQRLKQRRAVLRASVTKLLQGIQDETCKENVDCDRLMELLSVLSLKEKSLLELEPEIEGEIPLEELDADVARTLEYQDNAMLWRTRATRAMEKTRDTDTRSPRISDVSRYSNNHRPSVKLPKLSIKPFNGEVCMWQEFWDQYEAAIHDNQDLSKTERFTYLKSYLVGPAARALAGLKITDSSYDTAIDMLKKRFGRKDLVVSAHMSKLLNLSPVKRSSDVAAMRQLYDECEVQIRSLESLGVVSDSYGGLLSPILMQMIPDDLALEFTRRKDAGQEWKVTELLTFLQQEVESRERAMHLTKTGSTDRDPPVIQKQHWRAAPTSEKRWKKPNVPSAAALHAGSSSSDSCLFCDSPTHKSTVCKENTIAMRKKKLKKMGRCFVCLGSRHIARYCRMSNVSCSVCAGRHHVTLCDKNEPSETPDVAAPEISDALVSSVLPHVTTRDQERPGTVLLQTVRAWIEGPGGRRMVRCLIDGGSQRSFIHEAHVKVLKLPMLKRERLKLHTFGSQISEPKECNVIKVVLENIYSKENIEISAIQTPQICTAVIKVPGENIRQQMERKGLPLADVSEGDERNPELSVLIGADYYWKIVTGKIERLSEALVAVETVLGWAVQGPVSMSSMNEAACMHIGISEETDKLTKQLRAFWEIESLGITVKGEETPSDTEAKQSFDSSVKFINGRYEVGLPWRRDAPELPDNKRIAQKRFESLKRKLKSDVTLFKRYNDVIEGYVQQSICEDVQESDEPTENGSKIMYYLPHHAVIREDKVTTKLRVVFDASSHEEDCPSLNNCLLTGPNLNPDLLEILIRFRQHPIAFMGDIEKAFLQISLAERDRDVVRFIWLTGSPDAENTKLRIMRMTRVVFGVSSSPFLLAATIRNHLEKYEATQPHAVKILKESLYVDDLIASARDVEEAYALTAGAKNILADASMNLCKWTTNSSELKAKWSDSDLDFSQEAEAHGCVLKVLGLIWRPDTDDFVFDLKHLMDILKGKGNTERSVLRSSARIFDPIGFLTPFTIRVKCLFQEMWRRGISWDEELPKELSEAWQQWCAELPQIHQIVIPRWYGADKHMEEQSQILHVFTDASEKAYGAVAYLQGRTANEGTVVRLVASKSKVAPIKTMTLPRLELMGALIGSRMGNKLLKALHLQPSQLRMWSDSMIVIHWIRSSAQKWKQFVANRVMEIQALTEPESWSHCCGKSNPADLTTRGQPASKLREEELWWAGPPFLRSGEQPTGQSEPTEEELSGENVNTELKSRHVAVQLSNTENVASDPLLQLEKYSKLQTVLRITAWIKRFSHLCRTKERRRGQLTAEELSEAERHWIREVQADSFEREITEIKAGKDVHKESRIREFKPFLDEHGLICVGGRLQQSDLSFREQHPWLLSSNHRFAEMMIRYSHEKVMHSGMRDTLVQLREKYWIPRARQLVKKCIGACVICKRFKVKAVQQITAPLPRDRITESPPFEITGVDFAGPLYVKVKRTVEKVYVALFTCAVTRAVHLELVSSMSTENFLLALKRFISRRGLCRIIYSDNAQTFKRADQDLKELWRTIKEPELLEYFSEKGIVWKFIAERAAWWGGFWERLVRSVKTCLRRVMGRASLGFEELTTLLSEVEATINSRPITFVYNDLKEPQPLTPAHFLIGKRLSSLPPKPFTAAGPTMNANREELTRRWKYRQRLITEFWTRWKREYLLELKSAHTRANPRPTPLKEGDLVLIGEDKRPRLTWRTGLITELFQGRDGLIRSCAVRTPSGTTLRRPVQLLYPFEVHT